MHEDDRQTPTEGAFQLSGVYFFVSLAAANAWKENAQKYRSNEKNPWDQKHDILGVIRFVYLR